MKKDRPLGFWETLKVLTHDLYNGSDIIVVSLSLMGNLNLEILKKAFEASFSRHAILGTILKKGREEYWFRANNPWEQIPFHVINIKDEKKCDFILEKEMNTLFPTDQYLFRITVLQNKESLSHHLITSYHHAICDGASIIAFLYETFNYYEKIENGEKLQLFPLRVHEPQDKLLHTKINWEDYLKYLTKYQAIGEEGWHFHKNVAVTERLPRRAYKKLSLNEISQIKTLCKIHHVKLDSFLSALAFKTKQKLTHDNENGTINTILDTRSICSPKVSTEHLGYFISSLATKFDNVTDEINIWDLADRYETQLKKRLPELTFFPGSFDKVQAMSSYNMDFWPNSNHFLYDIALSYVPWVPIKGQFGSVKLVDVNVGINVVSGYAGMVLEIFTFSGRMTISCSYAEPLLDNEWVKKFLDQYVEELLRLAA